MNQLGLVKQYWEEYMKNLQVNGTQWGSKEFFQQYVASRDKLYDPYVHSNDLLQFRSYKGKSVLDVGCGFGLDAVQYAINGAYLGAIDLSPTAIDLAKKNFMYNNCSATIEEGNAEDIRFETNTFDLVISLGVLHHTPHTERAVNEIHRVLKPGGRTIIMFCNKYSWYVLLAKLSRTNLEHEAGDPPIFKLFSKKQVSRMFQSFSKTEIILERFPCKTSKRTGIIQKFYNHIFVPLTNLVPKTIIQPFGFHIIIIAHK